MALTILEAAKINPGDVFRNAIIEMYAEESEVLRVLPFETIQGNAISFGREETLPLVGFRGVNEAFAESTGVTNPITESLTILGGDMDVDKYIIDTMGPNQRAIQERMKIKAQALRWTLAFIKGDSSADPREFDGLQRRVPVGSSQLIDAGATSGGDVLSLFLLDTLISKVPGCNALLMNMALSLRITQAARSSTVGGFITWAPIEFGRQIARYNGIPILVIDEDNTGAQILPFTEANPGGGTAASTSIYAVNMREGNFTGIQRAPISVRDMGELQTKPAFRTRVEWYASMALWSGRAVARLRGVKTGAVVV